MEELFSVLIFVGIIYAVFICVLFNCILNRAKMSLHLSDAQQPPDSEDSWAQNNSFEFVGNYKTKMGKIDIEISAWKYVDRPSYFCKTAAICQNNTQTIHEFNTHFSEDVSLNTANKMDAHTYPEPILEYKQSFSRVDLDTQWASHLQMENYLMDEGGAELIHCDREFEELFQEDIHKHAAYIRSIPFWPLRGVYWCFIRKHFWHNLSIKDQRQKGMIRLPNEVFADGLVMPEALPFDDN